jgi:hypothetical protein
MAESTIKSNGLNALTVIQPFVTEAKTIANLDSDLAFNTNKVIKDALNKQNKK